MLWIFLVAPYGLFNERPRRPRARTRSSSCSAIAPHQNWIGDPTAMNSVIVLNAWTTSGTFMLFYLASLQSISHEVYEAAAIDGASAWQIFWRDHVPAAEAGPLLRGHGRGDRRAAAVRPGVHRAAASSGDPDNALMTVVLYLYNAAFTQLNFGYAAAVGIILFVDHLRRDARPAAAVRRGARMVSEDAMTPVDQTRAPRTPRRRAAPATAGDRRRRRA